MERRFFDLQRTSFLWSLSWSMVWIMNLCIKIQCNYIHTWTSVISWPNGSRKTNFLGSLVLQEDMAFRVILSSHWLPNLVFCTNRYYDNIPYSVIIMTCLKFSQCSAVLQYLLTSCWKRSIYCNISSLEVTTLKRCQSDNISNYFLLPLILQGPLRAESVSCSKRRIQRLQLNC